VFESNQEIAALQNLLDKSMDNAGGHIGTIFDQGHRLSARQVCVYLQGVKQVAAATVSSRGEPRNAPIDAVFFHGKFHLSTDAKSLRARHLAKRPAISLTYFESADPVIIVHGSAEFVRRDSPDFGTLDSQWQKTYGRGVTELSEGVMFIRVEPRIMLAYSHNPQRFPKG
jgi:Pyridoxamine 5'-phosphate oxidase